MKKIILFIDPVTPKPYIITDSLSGRMGGTEATVCRVARELSERYDVYIEQRGRKETETVGKVTYLAEDTKSALSPDIVVTLRDGKVYRQAKQKYPESRHYIWLHDVVGGAYQEHLEQTLCEDGPHNVICVSQWHKGNIYSTVPDLVLKAPLYVSVMYNPIDRHQKVTSEYDPYQLIFYSSPHKGLDMVLEHFKSLKSFEPKFKLLVANPGYFADHKDLPNGATQITPESHYDLMQLVAQSLCKFYPQSLFPETFGIVYAEANNVGTPVLAHNIGAATEVLDNQSQIVNCNNPQLVIRTLLEWSQGKRPTVSMNKLFSTEEVKKSWIKLIEFHNEN